MFLNHIRSIWSVKELKTKIIFTLLMILVFNLLSVIPVPWVNTAWLEVIMEQQKWLAFFSSLMGWWLKNFSIILMWLSPYINALIIIQLLWVIVPRIEALQKEWEQGQRKINMYTRYLTLPLAFAQSYWMIVLLNTLAQWTIIDTSNWSIIIMAMLIVTTGTLFLMWIWEVMTEYGIWNGISIIITAWVLSSTPWILMWYFNTGNYELFTWLLIATLAVIYIIIKFTEWYRKIPVIYTRTWREEKSSFPIRINQAWMIPIIFAISIVTFPAIAWQILSNTTWEYSKPIWDFLISYFSFNNPSWVYIIVYFLLIVLFSFFYVSITFNTEQVAESIQKRGGYIPGIRPWKETADYLMKVSNRLNVFGWSFLWIIAVFPYIMSKFLSQSVDLLINWAWLIIIVSVILDLIRKVDSEMKMFDYSKFR